MEDRLGGGGGGNKDKVQNTEKVNFDDMIDGLNK